MLDELEIPQAPGAMAASVEEAVEGAKRVGFPVLVRPSYVLGGRAMVIAYDEESIVRYMKEAVEYSQDRPVLIDHFLEDAIEVDVDALSDGEDVVIGGGNLVHLTKLPKGCRAGNNAYAFIGGFRMWNSAYAPISRGREKPKTSGSKNRRTRT